MTTPSVSAQLEIALDELDIAHITLNWTLNDALHSAMHSTYTAALKRILAFNAQTMNSVQNLVTVLKRRARQLKP